MLAQIRAHLQRTVALAATEARHITTSAKHAAITGQHHDVHALIRLAFAQRRCPIRQHAVVKGIELFRAIQGNRGDLIFFGK